MVQLSTLYEPIREDLGKVEERIKLVSKVDSPWLSELLAYSLSGGGKRIRPVLTLLSGRFYDYNPDNLLLMATAVELMHAATLVHDDAIDRSSIRWGRPTVYEVWGEEKAILLGDYLFARAGVLTADTHNFRAIRRFAETLSTISWGQLEETSMAFSLEQTRVHYFARISGKTASLFSMALETGAALSQAPEKSIDVLKEYGYNFGIAFQIVDDVLDFVGTEEELGKPVGSDLAHGTLTLPAMLLLERYPEENPVKKLFQERDKQENIDRAIEIVRNSTIVRECYELAARYTTNACRNLNLLPDNASRQALEGLANYVVERRR
jgi:geranylgeranyl pyrophosphate synthase